MNNFFLRSISSIILCFLVYFTYVQEKIVLLFLFFIIFAFACREIINSIKKIGRLLLLFLVTANLFLISYHVLLLNDKFFLFFIMYIAALHDCGGYIIGSLLGKNKIIPEISPKKTFEGFLGSIAFSIIGLKILSDIFPLTSTLTHPINYILCPLLCFLGDLLCSHVKRINKIKDFSSIIPGHGGIMDRLDSTLLISWYLHIVFMW